jgi:hypothetical protein
MRASVMNLKMQKQMIADSFMDDKPQGQSSIKRASLKFQNSGGVDAEELQIQNDRLKTTVMILT